MKLKQASILTIITVGLCVLILFWRYCSILKKEEVILTIYNQTSKQIDSIQINLAFSTDTFVINEPLLSKKNKTYSIDDSKQNIQSGVGSPNFFKYYISGKEFQGNWGLVDGWLSVQQDTIYIFNGGWSSVNDSTKLCSK